MKVFFDTNVYVAESLLGESAEAMLSATVAASWRIFINGHVLDEIRHVLIDYLGFSARLARLTCERCARRAIWVEGPGPRHEVPGDPADVAILNAALHAGADYLVTNDRHLLECDPCEGLRIVSMSGYYGLLTAEGLIQ
jgi:predicted nucleic acid-binding protein